MCEYINSRNEISGHKDGSFMIWIDNVKLLFVEVYTHTSNASERPLPMSVDEVLVPHFSICADLTVGKNISVEFFFNVNLITGDLCMQTNTNQDSKPIKIACPTPSEVFSCPSHPSPALGSH